MNTILSTYIFNIQHYSLHDGPGIRTTVFVKGCPLRCKWCCNPESQNPEPEYSRGRYNAREMTIEEILDEVEQDEVFYRQGGGMTVSGGEPLLQGEFLVELLKEAKAKYIHTAIETSGFGSTEILERSAAYLDFVHFDIKHLDPYRHKEWTDQDNEIILHNFNMLKTVFPELPLVVRTPIIPGFNDKSEDIEEICQYLSQYDHIEYELLKYHAWGKMKYETLNRPYLMEEAVLDDVVWEKLQSILKKYGYTKAVG